MDERVFTRSIDMCGEAVAFRQVIHHSYPP